MIYIQKVNRYRATVRYKIRVRKKVLGNQLTAKDVQTFTIVEFLFQINFYTKHFLRKHVSLMTL
jgi:hypothetical protein